MRDGVTRADGSAELRRSFEKDVLPAIGPKPVREVTEHDLRAVLRVMVGRGVHRMAVRTYCDMVQMFAWGGGFNRSTQHTMARSGRRSVGHETATADLLLG